MAVLLFMFAGVVPPVAASELPASDEAGATVTEGESWAPAGDGIALFFWSQGGRIYQLDRQAEHWDNLIAYDAETRAEAGRVTLQPPAWGNSGGNKEYSSAGGRHHVAAVDEERGRVFVAYRTSVVEQGQVGSAPCGGYGVLGDPGCVGGLHVVDGAGLDVVGRIPLTPPAVDGVEIQPIPRALEYAPADEERGWGGRVLMVVDEIAHGPAENQPATHFVPSVQSTTPRRNSTNLAHLIQFDPETMRQEWVLRLDACRNSREGRNWFEAPEGNPVAVFRSEIDGAIYVACHANAAQQGVVMRIPLDADGHPASLPIVVADPVESAEQLDGAADEAGAGDPQQASARAEAAQPVRTAPRQEVFPGPDRVTVMLADPASGRILMRVIDAGEVWWVFDTAAGQYIGTVGIGDYNHGHTTHGLDPHTGRLYVLAARPLDATGPGGLYMADIRRDPLPQALIYEDFSDPARTGRGLNTGGGATDVGRQMSVMPRDEAGVTRVFQSPRVILDASPISVDAPGGGEVVRTLDLPEAEGVTEATFDGTARGFGFRTVMLGGAEGAARVGPADPVGLVRGTHELEVTDPKECTLWLPCVPNERHLLSTVPLDAACVDAQRELIVAFAGPEAPAVVDASSARGASQPVVVDVRTEEDIAEPVSRCAPRDWKELWNAALFSRPPVEEPTLPWVFDESRSSCTATSEERSDSWNDPVLGAFASQVDCGENEVRGWGQARGVELDGVSVAHALSSFRVYRDPHRGMVARVESLARGVNLGGLVKIDSIRGAAESWANGRSAPEDARSTDTTVPNLFNCDRERPAGTCFQRQIAGVTVTNPAGGTAYRCGPCGPEDEFIDAINRALGSNGYARFREPDPELARGSDDGYVAAITKKDKERFADIVMNADLLETMVPMLEIVRYAPHNRQSSANTPAFTMGTAPRGRQVYQFAAVEVSSTYGIQCLLVYDEATNTCGEAKQPPGSLTVSLADTARSPLAGGAFEVREDVDADGVLGLKDTLLPNGACVTAADGVGTCKFESLRPGTYLVSQVAAPTGYAKFDQAGVVEIGSGQAVTLDVVNASNVAVIDVKADDESGAPLAGATFAAYPDPDADGKVAADAQPAGTCTTAADGTCRIAVPAGGYVLVQTAAPDGLVGIDPVAFTVAGGQTAAVGVVNHPPEGLAAPAPAPAPGPEVSYEAPPALPAPETSVDAYEPPAPVVEESPPDVSVPEAIGGTVVRVVRAPGDTMRLFAREPKEALAWLASLALFAAAAHAVRRRARAAALGRS